MERVSNKYKIMKTKEVWNAPSAEQKKLVALEAKISELKKKYEDKKAKLNQNKKRDSNKRESSKEKGTETRNQKKTKVQKPEWMFQKPKDADLRKPREWNGATWHYCSPETGGKCHGVYRVHKPSECRSKGQSQGNGGQRKGKNIKSHEVTISEALSELNGNGYESEWNKGIARNKLMKYCIAYPLVTWLFEQEDRQSAMRVSEAVAMTTQPQAKQRIQALLK